MRISCCFPPSSLVRLLLRRHHEYPVEAYFLLLAGHFANMAVLRPRPKNFVKVSNLGAEQSSYSLLLQ